MRNERQHVLINVYFVGIKRIATAHPNGYASTIGKRGGVLAEMRSGSLMDYAEVGPDGKNYGYPFGKRDFVSSAIFNIFIICTD